MAETPTERAKRYSAGRFQNLLKEYGELLETIAKEVIAEYDQEINESTVDAVAMKYAKNQGARQAMMLFMQKLNSHTNESD